MILSFLAAILLGFSKAGFKGLGFLVVALLAITYSSKASTGVLLPMLIGADIMAISFYKKEVDWSILRKLLPWMILGVLVGVWVGNHIDDSQFKGLMGILIIGGGVVMLMMETSFKKVIPKSYWFNVLMGFGAGFSTMVGNLAGVFSNLYFLSLRIPKIAFISTAAWLFFFINIFKIPFHIWIWKTVSYASIKESLILFPGVIIGFSLGLILIKKVSNSTFRKYIIIITFLGGIALLLKT